MVTRVLLTGIAALLLGSVPAHAQIYAWRDSTGTLVLSDRKLDTGAVTYAVPEAVAIRATRPVAVRVERERYEPLVQAHSTRHALRPELVRAVIQVESGFNPRARSPKGAMGLMQLMPATAREMGVRNAYDPDENIRGGTAYLRRLIDRYDGNEMLALAAYNAGPMAVDRHGRMVPPYRETREYVKKVNAVTPTRAHVEASVRPGLVLYKTLEIVDGREIPRYSTTKPSGGAYETVGQ